MKNYFLSFLSVSFFVGHILNAFSQERPLGTWKSFMPYGNAVTVCDAGSFIYCASQKSIFSYEKSTGTIQTYDKAIGLNDIGIKTMNYDAATNFLVIAYNNSNVDLIYNGTDVYNIPDIKNKATTGAISIYGISFYDGNAYVSSDIGISIINLSKKEISNTYIIGSAGGQVKVYSTSIDGTNIYAATEEGVKFAPLTSPNLQNFNTWTLFGAAQNLPQKKAPYVASFNGKVYAVISGGATDTIFEYNGTTWDSIYSETKNIVTSLNAVNGSLYFTLHNNYNTTAGKQGKVDASRSLVINETQGYARPMCWFESNGVAWAADMWNGLYKNTQSNVERIVPDGPYSSATFDLERKNNILKVTSGGVGDGWDLQWNTDGFYTFNDNKWTSRNLYTDPSLNNYSDILSVATISPRNKTYYGSFLSGLIEVDDNSGAIKLYDKWTNGSLLEGATGDTQRTKISSIAADRYNNLWIGNAGATKPIKMITSDGTWKEFSTPYSFDLMKKIVIDQNDQLWAPLRGALATGILVWSYNGTIDDPSDDKFRLLKAGAGNGGLPDPVVYSLAEDLEGNMWVGTAQGIAVFYCAGSVLSSSGCDADQIKVDRDGYIGYLFGTETVRAIAVDAANRKWIGTSNGLWLISADGKQELLKFTVDNSPLPNNQIADIAIDEKTGEVFIGTIGGLVSYQGDAISDCSDCDAALVYPNPVKPDYDGPIAIKGLTENAYVKITDVTGTLIFQGKANGCQMIWNGKGYNGNRAKSGVYLVFSSTDLGKEKRVGKILIAN